MKQNYYRKRYSWVHICIVQVRERILVGFFNPFFPSSEGMRKQGLAF